MLTGQNWDSGIKIGVFGGGTIIGLYNANMGAGDSTVSHVFAIRQGYDNNANGSFHDIVVTRNDYKVTMSKSENNTIVLTSPLGNAHFFLIGLSVHA